MRNHSDACPCNTGADTSTDNRAHANLNCPTIAHGYFGADCHSLTNGLTNPDFYTYTHVDQSARAYSYAFPDGNF